MPFFYEPARTWPNVSKWGLARASSWDGSNFFFDPAMIDPSQPPKLSTLTYCWRGSILLVLFTPFHLRNPVKIGHVRKYKIQEAYYWFYQNQTRTSRTIITLPLFEAWEQLGRLRRKRVVAAVAYVERGIFFFLKKLFCWIIWIGVLFFRISRRIWYQVFCWFINFWLSWSWNPNDVFMFL